MRIETLARDAVLALRTLRKSPGFSLVVVLTLGLAIAANTIVFSLLNPYLVRALPFGEADRLVQLGLVDPVAGWDGGRFSLPMLEDWKARSRAFEDMAGYYYGFRNVTGEGESPERIQVGYLTVNMFEVLRAPAQLGRTFAADEGGPAGNPVVVLDNGLWQRRYAGDPAVVGRTIRLDGVPHTVIGVMPQRFTFPFGGVKLWVPMREAVAAEPRDRLNTIIIGRLRDGWSAERAHAELAGIQRELAAQHRDVDGRFAGVSVKPLREALNFAWDVIRIGFAVLFGAVITVLLIACVNVASLMLARGSARASEVAVRTALGARRVQLVQQFLTESLLLALAGGALGIALAWSAVHFLSPLVPEDLYRVGAVSLDVNVLLFALAATLVAPLIFGLAPALRAARPGLTEMLKEGGAGAGVGRTSLRGRRALVVFQISLALVLVTGAGLMIRSFLSIQRVALGFHADRLLTIEVTPPSADYESTDAVSAYFDRAVAGVAAVPGVTGAATVYPLPLNHENLPIQFSRPEDAAAPPEQWPVALASRATPGYFAAMGIQLLAGRDFDASDRPDAPPVVIVSRALAERHWPGGDAIGRTLLVGDPASPTAATVVGVVGDIQHDGLATRIRPHVYRPMSQSPARRRFIVAGTAGPPAGPAAAVRAAVRDLDPNLPVAIRPMPEILRENDFQWSLSSVVLGAFGALALALAAIGVYGVVAYSASRRRREMGIRMALGATPAQVRRLVLGEGLRLAAAGVVIGLALALAAARLIASLLYGVGPLDPVTFGVALLLFIAVAAAASLAPAARAGRVQPQTVLRHE